MSEHIYLTIWVHGTHGDSKKPCGEVDIITIGGADITVEILEVLLNSDNQDRMEWFGHIPTEAWYKVEIESIYDTGDSDYIVVFKECWHPKVIGYVPDTIKEPAP